MTETKSLLEKLFKLGVHLGHKGSKVHPKAKKYIYSYQSGLSIIDLTQTIDLLEKAINFVTQLAKEGKTLLFVVTKKISSSTTLDLCQKNHLPAITTKWPAGLLTNFDNIIKNVIKFKTMQEAKEKGEWKKFVKHEQLKLNKQLKRLEKFYGGITNLKKLPDALFVVDIKKEKNAVEEAKRLKIPIIALVDTNCDPTKVDFPIPGNDDLEASVNFFVNKIINAYTQGLKLNNPQG